MLLLLALALLGLTPGARAAQAAAAGAALQLGKAGWVAPWFCHGIDCPPFTVINTTEAYEVRYYEKGAGSGLARGAAARWACCHHAAATVCLHSGIHTRLQKFGLQICCAPCRRDAGVWVSTDVETYAYMLASTTGFRVRFQGAGVAGRRAATQWQKHPAPAVVPPAHALKASDPAPAPLPPLRPPTSASPALSAAPLQVHYRFEQGGGGGAHDRPRAHPRRRLRWALLQEQVHRQLLRAAPVPGMLRACPFHIAWGVLIDEDCPAFASRAPAGTGGGRVPSWPPDTFWAAVKE